MKQLLTLILCAFTITSFAQIQEAIEPNYIESGYYQLIYEADIARLEGNEDLAFEKYEEAERRCPLINQQMYQEIHQYAALLIKHKKFEKAKYYMDKLASEYGEFPVLPLVELDMNSEELLDDFLSISGEDSAQALMQSLDDKINQFYTPDKMDLIEEIADMFEKDQEIREEFNEEIKKEFPDREGIMQKIKEVDERNAERLLEIINEYGLPTRKKWKVNDIHFDKSISVSLFIMPTMKNCEI